MSRSRGLELQRALARYLTRWFPHAESTPSGRPGSDILGTPGIVWENKTAVQFKPTPWARQSAGHAKNGELSLCVYWPPGTGEGHPEHVLVITTLPQVMKLLEEAGYVPPPEYPQPPANLEMPLHQPVVHDPDCIHGAKPHTGGCVG